MQRNGHDDVGAHPMVARIGRKVRGQCWSNCSEITILQLVDGAAHDTFEPEHRADGGRRAWEGRTRGTQHAARLRLPATRTDGAVQEGQGAGTARTDEIANCPTPDTDAGKEAIQRAVPQAADATQNSAAQRSPSDSGRASHRRGWAR